MKYLCFSVRLSISSSCSSEFLHVIVFQLFLKPNNIHVCVFYMFILNEHMIYVIVIIHYIVANMKMKKALQYWIHFFWTYTHWMGGFIELCIYSVLDSFTATWWKLNSYERRESQLKSYLPKIRLMQAGNAFS